MRQSAWMYVEWGCMSNGTLAVITKLKGCEDCRNRWVPEQGDQVFQLKILGTGKDELYATHCAFGMHVHAHQEATAHYGINACASGRGPQSFYPDTKTDNELNTLPPNFRTGIGERTNCFFITRDEFTQCFPDLDIRFSGFSEFVTYGTSSKKSGRVRICLSMCSFTQRIQRIQRTLTGST